MYILCTYDIFSRAITIPTVVHGVYIQFWPTLVEDDGAVKGGKVVVCTGAGSQ